MEWCVLTVRLSCVWFRGSFKPLYNDQASLAVLCHMQVWAHMTCGPAAGRRENRNSPWLNLLIQCYFIIRSGHDTFTVSALSTPRSGLAHIMIWWARPHPEVVRPVFCSGCIGVWTAIWAQRGQTTGYALTVCPEKKRVSQTTHPGLSTQLPQLEAWYCHR
jgi:hypothetical protein